MENYEQKYKEALAKARVVNPGTEDYNIVTAIFPELKESEDERIRKELIDFFKSREYNCSNRFISWLEKQGEQKPVGDPKQKWSSEDESRFACLLGILNWVEKSNYSSAKNVGEYIHWLQSLKQRLNGDELSSNENK